MNALTQLLEYQKEISNLEYTINLLKWELKINAPKNSQPDLIKLITQYESKLFELLISEKYGTLLTNVINDSNFDSIEEAERRYIQNLWKHYQENKKIPMEFYTKYSELKKRTNIAWREAKEQNNYELFKPYLKEIIEMTKQYYGFLSSDTSNLYDIMLEHYEVGMTSAIIDPLFEQLKQRLLPLIPTKVYSADTISSIPYSKQELLDCAEYLLNYIGFDRDRGALGIYPHGFTGTMGPNDVRIAFKHGNNPFDFCTTIIHEGGHGIFEQNISPNLSRYGTNVCGFYGLHESQSRFYENILGRNINFWIPIYEDIKKLLRLDISLEEFVEILNTPALNLIRTQADELTYCMHIILRYEIERDIFNGNIDIEDLPSIWNQKVKDYLHLTVDSPANGILQDVHWSEGDFGYFPSYLLGTIYDGMFIQAIERDLGSIDELLKKGKIKEITNYFIHSIYQNGGAFSALEIIKKMCQSDISIEPIAQYFEKKYSLKK